MSANPYKKYQRSPLWKAVEKAIADLVKNGDLTETTSRDLIVGYITKQVMETDQEQVIKIVRQKSKELESAIAHRKAV